MTGALPRMSRAGRFRWLVVIGLVALLEALCRTRIIDPLTMVQLAKLLASGRMNADILSTLVNVAAALTLAISVGFVLGALLFVMPRVRRVIDPLLATYYAVPIFVFYPFFVVLFGLNRYPQICIGFLLGVVAMIVSTLNGFDRVPGVLLKTARIHRLSRLQTITRIILPYATLYICTGLKLAVAYSFIGVIAAEFILAGEGMGYEINFAFNDFDNKTMYPLILLIIVASTVVNMALYAWEKKFAQRQTER